MDKLSERLRKIAEYLLFDCGHNEHNQSDSILEIADEVAQLEAALDKRLKQEYVDEDHRLGGTDRTFEEFKKSALEAGGE